MKTPFTTEQFIEVFKDYNQAVFPMQAILFLLGLITIYLAIKHSKRSYKWISIILSFLWLWMGIVYHLIFFTSINPAAYIFGIAFIVQGILFLLFGIFQQKLSFQYHPDVYGILGIVFISFSLFIYPVLGYFLGHVYPSSPTFGLPCPTTIFTFGLLLLSVRKCPVIILIIPLIWSIIGFAAAFNFGIIEDTGLIVAGLTAFLVILFRNRMLAKKEIVS